MNKSMLVARERIDKHPILRVIATQSFVHSEVNIKNKPLTSILKVFFWRGEFIVSDPIVAILCLWRKFTFYSLEMFEYQVEELNFKDTLRNILFKSLHYLALKKAHKVIFPNAIRKKFYLEQYSMHEEKCFIYPNYPSEETLISLREIRKEINGSNMNLTLFLNSLGVDFNEDLTEKDIFVYIGTISKGARGVKKILESVRKKKNAFLILAGPQKQKIFEKDEVGDYYIYIGEVAHISALKLLFLSDFGFLYYSTKLKNTNYCAPVKLFEYINTGVNLVANKSMGLNEYKRAIMYYLEDDDSLTKNSEYQPEFINQLAKISYESNFENNS